MPKSRVPPHFIVFVPGFLGSVLQDNHTGETVWIDFSRVPLNPFEWGNWLDHLFEAMRYPNQNLQAVDIIDEVIFAQPWIKQEQYGRLLTILESMGYRADPNRYSEKERNVYTFAYDWRQDNRTSGRLLGQAIARWRKFHPRAQVWLMAHSNGGVVARWYIEKEGGKQFVNRLILLASPWDGAVKGMYMLFEGFDVLFRQRFNLFNIPERTRAVLRTFPSLYQLIPHHAGFLRNVENRKVNPFAGRNWLDEPLHRQLLADAKKFNQELGDTLSVDTLVFFGRKQSTTTNGVVHFDAGTRWGNIEWQDTEQGDGTLPETTAVFAHARENIPVVASHGDIYVNPSLCDILRWELRDKYQGRLQAVSITPNLTINFNPDREIYAPGDTINIWATVQQNTAQTPVSKARIQAKLEWRQPLPGSKPSRPRAKSPNVRLIESISIPGRYEGVLTAPAIEGYYQLTATVRTTSNPPIELQELIVIEATD